MSISSETNAISYVGNASTSTAYAIPFRFDDSAWLDVSVVASDGTVTAYTAGVDYTVTGDGSLASASFTTTSSVPATSTVRVQRATPKTQLLDLTYNTKFPSEDVEDMGDKHAMMVQDLDRDIADNLARSLRVPDGETAAEFPAAATRASRYPAFDASGAVTTKSAATILAESGGAPTGVGVPTGGGTGDVLIKNSGDDNDHSWEHGGGVQIIADGSITERTLGDRFSDRVINVKDYGAKGDLTYTTWDTVTDYGTDDTLAIMRAIAAACDMDNAKDLTFESVTTYQGCADFPEFYRSTQGRKIVYFPPGNYRITAPLRVSQGVRLVGADPFYTTIVPDYRSGGFNAIESTVRYKERNYPFTTPSSHENQYCANVHIERLGIRNVDKGTTPTGLDYYPHPSNTDSQTSCSATASTNTITVSQDVGCYAGDKIRMWDPVAEEAGTVYTVASSTSTTITTVESITDTVSGHYLMMGFAKCNGIVMQGGEDATIKDVNIIGFVNGAALHVPYGSPGVTVERGISSFNKVAYWLDIYPSLLIRPSGDNNQVNIRTGWYRFANTTAISPKWERQPGSADPSFPPIACYQIGGFAGADMSALSILGGALNDADHQYDDDDGRDLALVDAWYEGDPPSVSLRSFRSLGFGGAILRLQKRGDSSVVREVMRNSSNQEMDWHYGAAGGPRFTEYSFLDGYAPAQMHHLMRAQESSTGIFIGPGLYSDTGSGELIVDPVTFTRSTTTVTVTTTDNHGLQEGDYVRLYDYSSLTGSGTIPFHSSATSKTADSWYTGYFRVQNVSTTKIFTLTCNADSGPTAGTVKLRVLKVRPLIDNYKNEIRHQMLDTVGEASTGERRAWGVYDADDAHIAGIKVSTAGEAQFWASLALLIGGSMGTPDASIKTTNLTATRAFELPNAAGLIPAVETKTDTGDSATAVEGVFCINTFDNNFKVYADGAWRTLTTW